MARGVVVLVAVPEPFNAPLAANLHVMSTVKLGLLQHACSGKPAENLKKTLALAEKAAKQGANIICTQELFRSQ